MIRVLAIIWIVLASVGVAVSIMGIRYSASKLGEIRRAGMTYDRHHPMRVLAESHLRHHIARGAGYTTWIFTGILAMFSPRPDVITFTLRGLLTLTVVLFVADSITDVRLRQRLAAEYASGRYDNDKRGPWTGRTQK